MKKLILILLLTFTGAFAQNSYIIDKKGNKSFIRPELTDVLLIDKRISYVNVGKSWEKYIKFEDLNEAVIGPSLLKSFHLNQQKRAQVFFVYAEKSDRKLIGVAITTTSTHGSMSSSSTSYELYVIDNNETIIDEIATRSGRSDTKIETRAKIAPFIRIYFSDCPELMSKLDKYDYADERNESILSFFSDTRYINCK